MTASDHTRREGKTVTLTTEVPVETSASTEEQPQIDITTRRKRFKIGGESEHPGASQSDIEEAQPTLFSELQGGNGEGENR